MKKINPQRVGGTITPATNITNAIWKDIVEPDKKPISKHDEVVKHSDHLASLAKPRASFVGELEVKVKQAPLSKHEAALHQEYLANLARPKKGSVSDAIDSKKPAPQSEHRPSMKGSKKRKEPHPLQKIFGNLLLKNDGTEVRTETLAVTDAVLGIYFSANWCPPCHTFTPLLKVLYNDLHAKDMKFDVVFISLDSSEQSFTDYFSHMPWLAVPYANTELREGLAEQLGVGGIPSLMFMNPKTQEIYRKNGRELLLTDPRGHFYPWVEIPDITEMKRFQLPSLRTEMDRDRGLSEKADEPEPSITGEDEERGDSLADKALDMDSVAELNDVTTKPSQAPKAKLKHH